MIRYIHPLLLLGLSAVTLFFFDWNFTSLFSQYLSQTSFRGLFYDFRTAYLRRHLQDGLNTYHNYSIHQRGVALCTGSKMIADAKAVIDQFRNVWNSTLPIAIVHCEEFDNYHVAAFANEINVQIFDICQNHTLFGMDHKVTRHRLRSWFCKAATLVLAPYDEVMVVDLDTIWFKKPDIMFDAPAYKQTGTLFMRDRITHDRARRSTDDRVFQDELEQFIHQHNSSVTMSKEYAQQQLDRNGVSFFWRNTADRNEPRLNNFQDSSVVMIDRRRHPRLLEVIATLIPTFNLGWGDKEMYWIAATIAGEDWSFEPFLSTLYGPCGVIMHYDPTAVHHPHRAAPMYVNAEWLVEKITSIGHDLEFTMPNPVLAMKNTTLFNLASARESLLSYSGSQS